MSWASIGYLILAGSLVGYSRPTAGCIGVAPLQRVATYAYVNPVVAVILGCARPAEPITPRTIVAGVVIVVAVALIVTGRAGSGPRRRRRPSPRPRREPARLPSPEERPA